MALFLFIDLHLDLCVHRNPDPNDEPVPFLFFSCRLFYSKSAMVYNPQKLINNLNFLYTFAVDHLVRRPQTLWGKIIGGFWQRAGVWGLDPSCPGLGLSHHARRTRAGRIGDVLSFRLCLCIMVCPRPWLKRRYILTLGSFFVTQTGLELFISGARVDADRGADVVCSDVAWCGFRPVSSVPAQCDRLLPQYTARSPPTGLAAWSP